MHKNIGSDIQIHTLNTTLYRLHKDSAQISDFGMDNTSELIDGGFGLYSTANTKRSIGPIKTTYYRIGFLRAGSATYSLGLETFHTARNTILFGFPGQVFSLQDPTPDFFAYYMLFSEHFVAESPLLTSHRARFPFLSYAGVQCFSLSEDDALEIEDIILKMNDEIKARHQHVSQAIQLYIQLVVLKAGRSYAGSHLSMQVSGDSRVSLFTRFLKLVSEHFLSIQKVSDYAGLLHVSADHLNRTIKACSDKTAHEWIDEMIVREAKASLLHAQLSIAEIAYQLEFADPSHFNKFFRKHVGCTPLQYRNKSE